jgi:hypothetical protein
MRASSGLLSAIILLCAIRIADAEYVRLDEPKTVWKSHIGKHVAISGEYIIAGKFGPVVSTPRGSVYILQWPRDVPPFEDYSPLFVEGRLRFQGPTPAKGRSGLRPALYYFLYRQCIFRMPVT